MAFNKICELKATNLNIKSLTRKQALTQTSIKIQFTWSAKWSGPYFCHHLELFWCGTRRTTLHCLNLHAIGFWRCYLLCITWSLFPHLGVKAPFRSFSASLSFRTMIWIVRCSLRTYLSYPLSSYTLHAVPKLVQDEKDFIYLHTARKRGSFIWS